MQRKMYITSIRNLDEAPSHVGRVETQDYEVECAIDGPTPTPSPLTELPHQNPSRIKTRETRLYYQNKMRDKYAKSKAINEAVAAIKRGEFIHYSNIAKKYKYNYNMPFKRVYKLIKTRKDINSFWY